MIRHASRNDEDAIWDIFQAVIALGNTYVFDPAMPREDALGFVDAHIMLQTL